MATQDLKNRVTVTQSLKPTATKVATVDGTSVDMSGFEGATIVYNIGTVVGAPIVLMEESDDDAAFTTVAAGDQSTDMPAALSSVLDDQSYTAAYLGSKRYIRPSLSDFGTSIFITADIIQHHGRHING